MDDKTVDQLLELAVSEGDSSELIAHLEKKHPADVADKLQELSIERAIALLKAFSPTFRGQVFGYFSPTTQLEYSEYFNNAELKQLLLAMSHDERADLFPRFSVEKQNELLAEMTRAERDDIRHLSSYPESSVGSIMTTDYAVLFEGMKAGEAFAKLKKEAVDKETIYRSYVVDGAGKLLGSVPLRRLIIAAEDESIRDIMEENVWMLNPLDDQELAAKELMKYDLLALPVVSDSGVLLGIVTHDDIQDVIFKEATEDIHSLGAVGDTFENMREAGVGVLYRKRIVWLAILVFANLVSGEAMAYYKDTMAQYIALMFFLPLLIDSSGNAGSQSATLAVRGLATGELVLKDWWRLLGKELVLALALGLTMGVISIVPGLYRAGVDIAVIVSLSMVLVVLVGCLIGITLPFILSMCGFDPATASAPLITTIVDAIGVLIYFSIATNLLPLLRARLHG